jgi:hypothetical protein
MRYLILALLFVSALASCDPVPEFEFVPEIEYSDVRQKQLDDITDSIEVVVRFQDGNGDLGLRAQENDPRYAPVDADGNPNPFNFNYFIRIFKETAGEPQEVLLPQGQSFNGRFPILNTTDQTRPLTGLLRFQFELFHSALGSPFNRGDAIFFEVQIADRALNLSNTITTESVTVGAP